MAQNPGFYGRVDQTAGYWAKETGGLVHHGGHYVPSHSSISPRQSDSSLLPSALDILARYSSSAAVQISWMRGGRGLARNSCLYFSKSQVAKNSLAAVWPDSYKAVFCWTDKLKSVA
jgi:hypothetical protein